MTPSNGPFGPENRTEYEYDPTLKATIIPSARKGGEVGGSMGFDPHNSKIKQNIVVCEENSMRTIAVVDNESLRKTAEKQAPDANEVEATYLTAANKAGGPLAAKLAEMGHPVPQLTDIPTRQKEEEEHAIPPATLDEPVVQEQTEEKQREEKPKSVPVSIKGPFGRVRQQYSSVFRDGNQLVLMTKHKDIASSYELPEVEDAAMEVEVQVNKKQLTCIWAGIQFTLPDDSVTFTVLLVAEEHNDKS